MWPLMTIFSNPVRLAFCSIAIFATTGIYLPFWPVWLAAQGITPAGIGMLVAMGYFIRILAVPAFSYVADRIGDRRAPFIWLSLVQFVAMSAFWLADGFWAIALVTVIETAAWSPLIPLKESLTMGWVTAKGYDYGRIRLWGSLSFIVLSVAGGMTLSSFGSDAILISLMGLSLVLILSGFLLPPDPRKGAREGQAKVSMQSVRALVSTPSFLLFLLAASATMSSHAVYYAFGTLNWQALGYSNSFIGGLWALGVVAEIALFAWSSRFVRHLSPPILIIIGSLAAIARWSLTAIDPHWGLLILLQCLHALTFGATHLGVMHYIARAVPTELSATAQGLYAAVGGGIFMGLVMLTAGATYEAIGAYAYLPMAGLGTVGLTAAFFLRRRWRIDQI